MPPRFALDTNVVIGALERREPAPLALLEAGRAGQALLALSRTFDDEFGGTLDEPLWGYVQGLPRLARPSAVLGHARLDEMRLDFGGFFDELTRGRSGPAARHASNDEEHIESALGWGADAFVTSDRELLRFGRARDRGIRVLTPEEAMEEIRRRFDPEPA